MSTLPCKGEPLDEGAGTFKVHLAYPIPSNVGSGAATGTPDRAQAADSLKAFLSVSILVVVTSKKAVDSADNG